MVVFWEQFKAGIEASTRKSKFTTLDYDDDSDEDEVCMPDTMPGGGFLDDMEDDLDCYDGYETQVYDLLEQVHAFCDQYDIRLTSHGRK
ncbi:hypothetical protein Tco_0995817 [Tanacetum coccineum]